MSTHSEKPFLLIEQFHFLVLSSIVSDMCLPGGQLASSGEAPSPYYLQKCSSRKLRSFRNHVVTHTYIVYVLALCISVWYSIIGKVCGFGFGGVLRCECVRAQRSSSKASPLPPHICGCVCALSVACYVVVVEWQVVEEKRGKNWIFCERGQL